MDRVDNAGQSAVLGPFTLELEARSYYYFAGQRVAFMPTEFAFILTLIRTPYII